MNLSKSKILLVLIVLGVLYVFFGGDESVPPTETQQRESVTRPMITVNRVPRQSNSVHNRSSERSALPPTFSGGFEQWQGERYSAPESSEFRFRPLEPNRASTGRYQSDKPRLRPQYPAYSNDLPGYDYPNYSDRYQPGPPGPASEQFRPLDEMQQSKRWQGNYRRMSTLPGQLALPGGSDQMRWLAGGD